MQFLYDENLKTLMKETKDLTIFHVYEWEDNVISLGFS